MALKHDRAATIKFRFESSDYCRMVVSNIVNAVSGEKVHNVVAISRLQFRTLAARVLHIHL
jgi:hypothetical protein